MPALSEFELDLCLIRKLASDSDAKSEFGSVDMEETAAVIRTGSAAVSSSHSDFRELVEEELVHLFGSYGSWSSSGRIEDGLELVLVEMKGVAPWANEEEALGYIEDRASDLFWHWLAGYQLRVEQKEDAGACVWKREIIASDSQPEVKRQPGS